MAPKILRRERKPTPEIERQGEESQHKHFNADEADAERLRKYEEAKIRIFDGQPAEETDEALRLGSKAEFLINPSDPDFHRPG